MQLAPLLPLLALFSACAGVKNHVPAEESPQKQWERVYREGLAEAQVEGSSTDSNAPAESPHPGYSLDPATNAHVWTPGATHSLRPHQTAGPAEGSWVPDLGYAHSPPGSTRVEWQVGVPHPTREHVISSTRAGQWVAERGYVLDDEGRAQWAPGRPDPEDPNLESGVEEGTWVTRPEREPKEGAPTLPDEPAGVTATDQPLAAEATWEAVEVPLRTAVIVQTQIDDERRARGVSRAGVLTELTDQLDRAMDAAVVAAFASESSAAHREVRAVALSGLESGFVGWGAFGTDHSVAAHTAVRSRCPAVVDVAVAAEFFVRLRSAAERLSTGAPGSVE